MCKNKILCLPLHRSTYPHETEQYIQNIIIQMKCFNSEPEQRLSFITFICHRKLTASSSHFAKNLCHILSAHKYTSQTANRSRGGGTHTHSSAAVLVGLQRRGLCPIPCSYLGQPRLHTSLCPALSISSPSIRPLLDSPFSPSSHCFPHTL